MSYNWQQKGWPNVTVDRSAIKDELKAFESAFLKVKKYLKPAQDPELTAETLTNEAVTTSAIEGVRVGRDRRDVFHLQSDGHADDPNWIHPRHSSGGCGANGDCGQARLGQADRFCVDDRLACGTFGQ